MFEQWGKGEGRGTAWDEFPNFRNLETETGAPFPEIYIVFDEHFKGSSSLSSEDPILHMGKQQTHRGFFERKEEKRRVGLVEQTNPGKTFSSPICILHRCDEKRKIEKEEEREEQIWKGGRGERGGEETVQIFVPISTRCDATSRWLKWGGRRKKRDQTLSSLFLFLHIKWLICLRQKESE